MPTWVSRIVGIAHELLLQEIVCDALDRLACQPHTARNFRHGVELAVNHPGDSDSTGAITGKP